MRIYIKYVYYTCGEDVWGVSGGGVSSDSVREELEVCRYRCVCVCVCVCACVCVVRVWVVILEGGACVGGVLVEVDYSMQLWPPLQVLMMAGGGGGREGEGEGGRGGGGRGRGEGGRGGGRGRREGGEGRREGERGRREGGGEGEKIHYL